MEVLSIILNITADDDSNVLAEIMVPHHGFLPMINHCLHVYSQSGDSFDDEILNKVLWIIGNLIGEGQAETILAIFENTLLYNTLQAISQWGHGIPSNLLSILSWLLNTISQIRMGPSPDLTTISITLLSNIVSQSFLMV